MKAQRVKNAVIVPTGAKGGFYPKALPDPTLDRDAWFAEGKECYRIFIRSLLSITDNIVGGKVVHPKKVAIHDGEDPYFVVRSEEHTSELQSLMRISYAVYCLKKKKIKTPISHKIK